MRHILVATNFSKEAENALHYGAALASEHKYKITLFYLKNISIHAQNAQLSADNFESNIKFNQKKLADKATEISAKYNIEVVPYYATGDFCEELEYCISGKKIDFVVLGLTKKTVEQEVLGNTTSKIVHKLKFPTLTIPLGAKYKGISNVILADDMNQKANWNIDKNLFELIKDLRSKIEVFHVSEKLKATDANGIDNSTVLEANSQEDSIMYKSIVSSEVIQSIKEEILLVNADWLIMIPHSYGFWNSLIHRSKTNVMLSNIDIPLLAIPSKGKNNLKFKKK